MSQTVCYGQFEGFDPHGQHARVSIKAEHLIAATKGQAIPFDSKEASGAQGTQKELFQNDE